MPLLHTFKKYVFIECFTIFKILLNCLFERSNKQLYRIVSGGDMKQGRR